MTATERVPCLATSLTIVRPQPAPAPRRNVDAIVTALALPVILMLLFVYLFGGAIETGSGAYVDLRRPRRARCCAPGSASAVTAVRCQQPT